MSLSGFVCTCSGTALPASSWSVSTKTGEVGTRHATRCRTWKPEMVEVMQSGEAPDRQDAALQGPRTRRLEVGSLDTPW